MFSLISIVEKTNYFGFFSQVIPRCPATLIFLYDDKNLPFKIILWKKERLKLKLLNQAKAQEKQILWQEVSWYNSCCPSIWRIYKSKKAYWHFNWSLFGTRQFNIGMQNGRKIIHTDLGQISGNQDANSQLNKKMKFVRTSKLIFSQKTGH